MAQPLAETKLKLVFVPERVRPPFWSSVRNVPGLEAGVSEKVLAAILEAK